MFIATLFGVTRRAPRILVTTACLLGLCAHAAATCVVTSSLDDPNDASAKVTSVSQNGWSGAQKNVATLRDCIVESNLMTGSHGAPTTAATIELSKIQGSVITLQDNLPLLFNNVVITTTAGNPVTISGNYAHRIFFVSGLPLFKSSNVPDPDGSQPIAVTLSNLILEFGVAHAGDGAGGGMGAGGALFVNKGATVTLVNVTLKQNMAIGGDALSIDQYFTLSGGGMGPGMSVWKGGGGLSGGQTMYQSGAGIGTGGTNKFAGGFGGTGIGQISLVQNFSLADFDVDNGSGTLGSLIGGGGLAVAGEKGGAGGFGGGGGFDIENSNATGGGDGGFGGGGAWAEDAGQLGGNGGFGGAGGGGLFFTTSGNGGFGAGAGATGDFSAAGISGVGGGIPTQGPSGGGFSGGGGAGFGGAVFVRSGATLLIQSTTAATATGNAVIPGGKSMYNTTTGAAAGDAMFVMTGAETIFNIAKRYTIYDDIADDSLISVPAGQTYVQGNGSGAVVRKTGPGVLVFDGVDSRAGATAIESGFLAGIGIIAGPVLLEGSAYILPGDPLINSGIGTLTLGSLTWYPNGTIAYQLGADDSSSDHLQVNGSLLKQGAGPFVFSFGSAAAPPVVGQTYRLISAADTSAFTAQDFSFEYDSSLQSLNGKFSVDSAGVYFSVTEVQP